MHWPVVFELTTMPVFSLDLQEWQRKVLDCQKEGSTEDLDERQIAQKDLFFHYVNLASKMAENRSVISNRMIMNVVVPPIRNSWIEYHEVWPLPFVVFQDYVYRFPDSKYFNEAKDRIVDYMLDEILLLNLASPGDSPLVKARQRLLNDLIRFLEEHYPDAFQQSLTETSTFRHRL